MSCGSRLSICRAVPGCRRAPSATSVAKGRRRSRPALQSRGYVEPLKIRHHGLVVARKIRPSVMSAVAGHASTAVFTHVGIGPQETVTGRPLVLPKHLDYAPADVDQERRRL